MDLSSKVLLSQEMLCLQKRKLCTHKYKRAKTVKCIRCGHPSLKLQNRPCHRGISIKQVGLWKQEGGWDIQCLEAPVGVHGIFVIWCRLSKSFVLPLHFRSSKKQHSSLLLHQLFCSLLSLRGQTLPKIPREMRASSLPTHECEATCVHTNEALVRSAKTKKKKKKKNN